MHLCRVSRAACLWHLSANLSQPLGGPVINYNESTSGNVASSDLVTTFDFGTMALNAVVSNQAVGGIGVIEGALSLRTEYASDLSNALGRYQVLSRISGFFEIDSPTDYLFDFVADDGASAILYHAETDTFVVGTDGVSFMRSGVLATGIYFIAMVISVDVNGLAPPGSLESQIIEKSLTASFRLGDIVSVPEPGTLDLLGAGLIGLAWRRRRT